MPGRHALRLARDLRRTRLRSGSSSTWWTSMALLVPGPRRSLSMLISEFFVDVEMTPLPYFVPGVYVGLLNVHSMASVNDLFGS